MKDHISAKDYKLLKTEHQIQAEIIDYLSANGWYTQRMNSGVIPQTDGNGKTRRIFMGKSGTPDIMAFKIGDCDPAELGRDRDHVALLFVEVKRPGRTATTNQQQMMQELEDYGAECVIATSVEDLEKQL